MTDKDAAKRRRQARNRQERINRQKRIEGARRSEAARQSDDTGRPSRTTSGKQGDAAPQAKSTGLMGKLFPPRPAPAAKGGGGKGGASRPARGPMESPVLDVGEVSGFRAQLGRRLIQPGGRATLLALTLAIVSAGMLLFAPIVPLEAFETYGEILIEDAPIDAAERAGQMAAFEAGEVIDAGTVRITALQAPGIIVVFALVPILIAIVAVASLTRPTRSRTLLMSALASALFFFVAQGLSTFFLPGVIALGWASYQSRKLDQPVAATAED